MNTEIGVAAVLEAALQAAVEGLKRAKASNNSEAMMAYYDVLSNAYSVAEANDVAMPNDYLASIDPDDLLGMTPRTD